MRSSLRSTAVGALLAGLALGAPVLLVGCGESVAPTVAPRPAMVARPAPVTAEYEVYPGEVHARHEPALAFRLAGKIVQRHVEVGQRVEQGQLLAELDPGDLELQTESARAQLAAAEADLELARAERDRHRNLLERQLISRSLADIRENQFAAAEARVRQARAQLEVAGNQADYTRLRAPETGVIAERLAEAGQVVAAGQPVFVLAADGEREVAISLPEQHIERYQVGQSVLVGLWSKPDQRIAGTLRELSPAADPAARTYAARVTIDAAADGIELGQSARVLFARNGSSALGLPLSALTADGGTHYVWVLDPQTSQVHRRAVEIGPFGDDSATILSGIDGSDWVVTGGVHLLQEGQRVRPVDRDNRSIALGSG